MKNIAIFASGNGSNFEAIVNSNLNCNIKVLICNNKNAFVINRAQRLNIACEIVEYNKYKSSCDYESAIEDVLNIYQIDLIVLAGYMKIFSENFVKKFENKIVNIHPSKLPNYKGLDAIKRAYMDGEKEIGVSVHYVDSGVDTGRVIACEVIEVKNGDTLECVEAKVHKLEHKLYSKVLEELL